MKSSVAHMYKLKDNRSFQDIFNILKSHDEKVYCRYIDPENGLEKNETYGEMALRSEVTAFTLQKVFEKIPKGTFIGIHFDNCPDWPVIYWGILMAGYNPILLDFRATRETLESIIEESAAGAIITETFTSDSVLVIDREYLMDHLKTPDKDWKPRWGDYLAYCTSGTTAQSRIYVYDGRAVAGNLYHSAGTFEKSPFLMWDNEVRILAFLPFYHIFGFIAILNMYAVCGSTFIYIPDRAPESVLETSRRFGVTHIPSVPLMWNNIIKKVLAEVAKASPVKRAVFKAMVNLSLAVQTVSPVKGQKFACRKLFKSLHEKLLGTAIHSVAYGGAYLSPENNRLLTAFGLPIKGGYGMTETGIICAEAGDDRKRRMSGSTGIPCIEAAVQTADNSKQYTGTGELHLRGDIMHIGRLKDGKLIASLIDEEGWFATGDIARIESDGRLFCMGRSKDTIVLASGENVYPDELEDHFLNVAGIDEYTIFGLKSDNANEKIVMLLNISREMQNDRDLKKISNEIHTVNNRLPGYKRVQEFYVSKQALPITTSMKTQRNKVITAIENNEWPMYPLDEPGENLATESADKVEYVIDPNILEKVRELFGEILSKSPGSIGDEDHFINKLGGDSLDAITLANELEKKFKIFIPDTVLLQCTNVKELATEIDKQVHNRSHGPATNQPLTEQEPVTDFTESDEYRAFQTLLSMSDYNPYFKKHDSVVKDTSVIDGKDILNFASYNYCGLSGHPETVKAGIDALEKYGSSASGSRLLTGDKTLYQQLEDELAKWKQTEAAIVLVSGHATNVTFVGNFCDENDLIVYDALSHNSIDQGCRLSKSPSKAFPHNDFQALENILESQRKYYRKVLIIVEGAYSMDGDIAPIDEFVRIKKKYGAFLMVDEAHSVAVIGKTGKGVDEHFNLAPDDVDIKMGTLSKGIGSCGGYLAANKSIIEYLKYNLPGFVFSVGITPANAAVALKSIELLQRDHSMIEQLQRNIKTFVDRARKHNFDICLAGETAIIPIMVGDEFHAMNICRILQEKGVFVVPAVYPAVPRGQSRLRFCVTSDHTEEQIHFALDTLNEVAKEVGMKRMEN